MNDQKLPRKSSQPRGSKIPSEHLNEPTIYAKWNDNDEDSCMMKCPQYFSEWNRQQFLCMIDSHAANSFRALQDVLCKSSSSKVTETKNKCMPMVSRWTGGPYQYFWYGPKHCQWNCFRICLKLLMASRWIQHAILTVRFARYKVKASTWLDSRAFAVITVIVHCRAADLTSQNLVHRFCLYFARNCHNVHIRIRIVWRNTRKSFKNLHLFE